MSKYHGLARVSVRCKPFPGVAMGYVRPWTYHPESFDPGDGRTRADGFRRIREAYARAKQS